MNRQHLSRVHMMILVVVLGASAAWAFQPGGSAGVPQPTLLRLSGFVGRAPAEAKILATVTLGIDRQVVSLNLTAVQTLNGPLTEGPAALRQFDLYNPNLLLVGDRSLLDTIATAPVQTKLTVFGYLNGNGHRFVVTEVAPQ